MNFIHIPKNAGTSIQRATRLPSMGHKKIRDIKGKHFACCRNPYDRAVSIYWFLKHSHGRFPVSLAARSLSIDAYWNEIFTDGVPMHGGIFQQQMEFLKEKDGDGVSERVELLRYETLAEDWPAFAAEHGMDELSHKNKSILRPNRHWSEELNKESVAKIAELYSEDFDVLGYDR